MMESHQLTCYPLLPARTSTPDPRHGGGSGLSERESDSDSDADVPETDGDRRRAMLESADQAELDAMKAWQRDYSSDFLFPPVASGSSFGSHPPEPADTNASGSTELAGRKGKTRDLGTIELSDSDSDSDEHHVGPRTCDAQVLTRGNTSTSGAAAARSGVFLGYRADAEQGPPPHLSGEVRPENGGSAPSDLGSTSRKSRERGKAPPRAAAMVRNEIEFRKKESLGLARGMSTHTLGGTPAGQHPRRDPTRGPEGARHVAGLAPEGGSWACEVCTL